MVARVGKLLAVNVAVLVALLLVLELVFRQLISYEIGYYVGAPGPGRHERPYGLLLQNALGHPDVEFDLSDARPRVGWLGDSVVAGVGAGYGYRFMDLLGERHPGWQHMALGGVGDLGIQDPAASAQALEPLGLDRLVYVMNLNDVLPTVPNTSDPAASASLSPQAGGADVEWRPHPLVRLGAFARTHLDWLRGRSYLYNWVRTQAKIALTRLGYEYHGMQAFELFPHLHSGPFLATCARIHAFSDRVTRRGTDFEVVLLPYEMQISQDAADRYAELGIRWEAGFEGGSAQAVLTSCLDGLVVHDARGAFLDQPSDRQRVRVGELFVYDRGDKLDWNHPNRAGHARLAAFLDERLPWLADPSASRPGGRP